MIENILLSHFVLQKGPLLMQQPSSLTLPLMTDVFYFFYILIFGKIYHILLHYCLFAM